MLSWVYSSGAVLFLTLLQCLEVVKSSFQPFPSDFEGGLCFLHTGGIVQEKESRMDPLLVSGQQRSHRMTPLSLELPAETVYVEKVMFTLLQCLEVVKSSFQPFPSDFEGGLCFLHTGGIVQEKENRMDPLLVSGQQRSHRMTPLSFELAAETVYVEKVIFSWFKIYHGFLSSGFEIVTFVF